MTCKHLLYTYREILCQQCRLQLDCLLSSGMADVALTGVYLYLKINLEQAQWEFKPWKLLPLWLGHFWFPWSLIACPHVEFGNCFFRVVIHVGGHLLHARLAFHITWVLSSCCLVALTAWALFFIMVVIPLWARGCNWFRVKGKRMGNSQSSFLAFSAHRQISLSSHTLLAAFPFQTGITLSSHLSSVFLDAAVCLISYFYCRCLCTSLDFSLGKCRPSLDCLCPWLHSQLRSGQCGSRRVGFCEELPVEHCPAVFSLELFCAREVLLHLHCPALVCCCVCYLR